MIKNSYFFTLLLLITFFSCKKKDAFFNIEQSQINWKTTQNYYLENINTAIQLLDSLSQLKIEDPNTKKLFFDVRLAFKKAEPYAGALKPEITHRANGPALPIYKDDSGRIIAPVGLQKLEETIFTEGATQNDFIREIFYQKGFFKNLKENISNRELNPKRFFVATHQQLMRIASLSMAGFDTPITGKSISETAVSLQSLNDVYTTSIKPLIKTKDSKLDSTFNSNIKNAIRFINKNSEFNTFDRFTFIREYLNPITRNWVSIRQTSNLWDGKTNAFSYNFDAPTLFEENSFNVNYFLDVNDRNPSKEKIALGKKLFFDKKLSKSGNLACVTCHLPQKGYADGLKLGNDNKNNLLQRNTPTLLNSIYQRAFFWDGRANTIENQINGVFKNDKEFNTNLHRFSKNILKDTSYITLFKKAFGYIPKTNKETVRAISVFISTLNSFNSKFDKNIRGEENNFTNQEKNGFNLYMGKALCATCHFIPLTNGTVPPFFNETEKEVIGIPKTDENKQLDNDTGFYWVYKEEIHKGMFKTPTIRNVELTGPYMHNGVYSTLEQVVDFYNKGGGGGLGFDLPHQTLPFDELNLTKEEQASLVAFMKTLTDDDTSYNSN